MRGLFFVLTFIIFVQITPAQSPLAKRAFNEATVLANAGNFEKASAIYRTALSAAENDSGDFAIKARYNLGVCYYRTNRLKESVAELERVIRLSKGNHPRAYYTLGMAESALENWPSARKAFLASISFEPENGEAWFDLAFVYLAERDYDSAAAAFRRSIDHRSVDSALGYNNIGVLMAMKFDLRSAEIAFQTALDLSGGRLILAKRNLEFCRSLSDGRRDLMAKRQWSFSGRGGNI